MNKKLFIFIFLIMVSPALADDNPFRDEVINELAPTLTEVQPANNNHITFAEKIKKKFSKTPKKEKVNLAKEIDAVDVKTESVKTKNLDKKEQKKSKKSEKKSKNNTANAVNTEEALIEEAPAVVNSSESNASNTILTDIAYHGSINTNKIIEVNDCVKIALEKHPAIISAMNNADIYKSKIAQAWSNYFPTLSAGVSYSRNDMQMSNFSFPVQKYDMFYTPTVSGDLLLFDFGKTKSQADIAKRTYEAAQYSLQTSINTVIYNVKQSYYNLLFAQQQVKVYEDTVKDYELHLEQAKAYFNIGTKPKIDVLTAEYNLGKAKLNLIQANNTLKIAFVQLSNAMGMPDYSDYDVTDNLTVKAYDINVDDAVNTAYETNPELLEAKKKADASELLVRSAKRAFTPDISGFASYTRGGKKVDTDYGYQFGAQLSYQTVNLMLLKKQVDEAKATYKKDLADYETTKQDIYFEVKQAYINLTNAQESIGVAKLSMDEAKEQYDQAFGRYKVGLGDAIELKDAETTFRNSQLDYYNTLLNYHVSAADLERLMGVPLQSSDTALL
ncbi:MAG: TolC family protein [Candidatus Gastranaerophilales bacterium]|nr:TolC family protein [Candidatus Gastranaerophilales bacterium]